MENVLQSRSIKTNARGNFFTEDKQSISPPLLSNNSTAKQISTQKHLGIHLDEELTFKHHTNEKINKANKGIGIIRKVNNILPCSTLLTIYCSSVRLHLDYGDVIYD